MIPASRPVPAKRMNYLLAYFVGALLVLAPVGVRMLTWQAQSSPVDPAMAEEGKTLFNHEWRPKDPLAGGDGLGPVYNATSCVACHHQGGPGGSGGVEHNVTVFSVKAVKAGEKAREGVLHSHAVGRDYQETLADIDSSLPKHSIGEAAENSILMRSGMFDVSRLKLSFVLSFKETAPKHVELSQRNTPALFGAKLIDEIPDRVLVAYERKLRLQRGKALMDAPMGRYARLADGRIGKFGWKAQSASLSDFVQAACANELGLSNPNHPQPQPLGKPDYQATGLDLTIDQCNQLTAFIASLPRPVERSFPADQIRSSKVQAGKDLFLKIGCANCHTPNLGSVDGIYSDLMLHHMGETLMSQTGSYNGPSISVAKSGGPSTNSPADEWRTPPLWGVADSAPYLHDGRANTLEDAIRLHGGEAFLSSRLFDQLLPHEQAFVIEFLKALQAP